MLDGLTTDSDRQVGSVSRSAFENRQTAVIRLELFHRSPLRFSSRRSDNVLRIFVPLRARAREEAEVGANAMAFDLCRARHAARQPKVLGGSLSAGESALSVRKHDLIRFITVGLSGLLHAARTVRISVFLPIQRFDLPANPQRLGGGKRTPRCSVLFV